MTKLQLLNVYLTERLTAAVREILDVVGDTVTEYREETARTKRENESLRRQLRDIVLLEAETDWLRPSRSIPLSPSGQQQHCEQEWHSSHVKGPDLGPTQQNQVNRSGPPQTQNQGVACQNGSLTDQNLGRREMEESQFNLSQMEVKAGPLESLTKTEPDVVPEAFGNGPSLVSPSSLNTHSVPASSASLEAAAFRVENQNPSPHQTQEPIKMEPEECDITASNPESHSDSGFPDCPVPLVLAHNPSEEAGLREASDMAVAEVPRGPDPQTHEADRRPEEGIPFEGGNDFDTSFQEERPHRCPRCGESFSQACSLRLHLQYRKPYACDWCCKSFAQSADLRRHLRTHTGERPHRCTWCSKSFTQRGNLRRHLRIHTGERPYSCPYCYRTFSDGDTMKKHKRTHSGEKPYRCSQCPKSFTVASGLQVHLKKHLRDGQLLT